MKSLQLRSEGAVASRFNLIVCLLVLAAFVFLSPPVKAGDAGASYRSNAHFRDFTVLDRNASKACQERNFRMYSVSIVHFKDVSVRVATRGQVRSSIPLTSEIFFVRYQGTSSCVVYVPN
jgi:hypothetical protein